MNGSFALLIGIFLIALISLFLYRFGKKQSNRLIKYIPAIACAGSIGLVYVKMTFLSEGYEPITDIVIMIVLSCVLGVSLIAAAVMDMTSHRKQRAK